MTDATTTPTLRHDDPRTLLAHAVKTASEVIEQISPAHLDLPTPCTDFDVRFLLGHLTAVLHRVANVGRGGSVFDTPEAVEGVPDGGWPDAWRAAAHEVQAVWSDDTLLEQTFVLPWAELPGGALLQMYTSEITVHTWDLATATGQNPAWDDAAVAASLALMEQVLPGGEARRQSYAEAAERMPEGTRDFTPPFADPVSVPAGAPLIDRLVAWTGRRP
jgi:uncharacterized protein (TIGR03086 family)